MAARKLEIVLYGIGYAEPAQVLPVTQAGYHELVKAWGLPTVEKFWTADGIDAARYIVDAAGFGTHTSIQSAITRPTWTAAATPMCR